METCSLLLYFLELNQLAVMVRNDSLTQEQHREKSKKLALILLLDEHYRCGQRGN